MSDEGGGISRSNMERIWSYLYTTANPRVLESMLNNDDGEIKVNIAYEWLLIFFVLYMSMYCIVVLQPGERFTEKRNF